MRRLANPTLLTYSALKITFEIGVLPKPYMPASQAKWNKYIASKRPSNILSPQATFLFSFFLSPINYLRPSSFICIYLRLKTYIILPPPSPHKLYLLKRITFFQKIINCSQFLIPHNFNCVHYRLLAFRFHQQIYINFPAHFHQFYQMPRNSIRTHPPRIGDSLNCQTLSV